MIHLGTINSAAGIDLLPTCSPCRTHQPPNSKSLHGAPIFRPKSRLALLEAQHKYELARWQREIERRTFLFLPFCPYGATVAFDDALHQGQADANTLELIGRMHPLKNTK